MVICVFIGRLCEALLLKSPLHQSLQGKSSSALSSIMPSHVPHDLSRFNVLPCFVTPPHFLTFLYFEQKAILDICEPPFAYSGVNTMIEVINIFKMYILGLPSRIVAIVSY